MTEPEAVVGGTQGAGAAGHAHPAVSLDDHNAVPLLMALDDTLAAARAPPAPSSSSAPIL